MVQHTSLNAAHRKAGARMVDFGGWDMPLHYGSQVEEHHIVRQSVGCFDVSHMTIVDVRGKQARPFLQHLLANDVARLKIEGKALYSCMLNPNGGVIDDLIVYYLDPESYRVVVNASTREKDLKWINDQSESFPVTISVRDDLSMIAVQGPLARKKTLPLLPLDLQQGASHLEPFYAAWLGDWFVGRTGYTGEDGFEVMLPNELAPEFWSNLLKDDVKPCGLGCRDTLRLEAGMNLYGNDMDESVSPLEAGLDWTIAWAPSDRDFIGRRAIESLRATGVTTRFVGLVLEGRGVCRAHQKVIIEDCNTDGEITSGSFSPTLQKAIAFARIPLTDATTCHVDIRGKIIPAKIVKPVFVRNGKALVT